MKKLFILVILCFNWTIDSQTVRINEVVSSNSTYFDEDGDTPDWIELFNFGPIYKSTRLLHIR